MPNTVTRSSGLLDVGASIIRILLIAGTLIPFAIQDIRKGGLSLSFHGVWLLLRFIVAAADVGLLLQRIRKIMRDSISCQEKSDGGLITTAFFVPLSNLMNARSSDSQLPFYWQKLDTLCCYDAAPRFRIAATMQLRASALLDLSPSHHLACAVHDLLSPGLSSNSQLDDVYIHPGTLIGHSKASVY